MRDVGGRRLMPRQERAASIVAAAARAFARGGYNGTSMDDVATEAGVTKIILYRHYATKKDIYTAALDTTWQRLVDSSQFGYDTEAGLRALLAAARRDPAGFTLLFRHAVREPDFAEYAQALVAQTVQVAEQTLADSVTDPRLRAWLARGVTDLVLNSVLEWITSGDADRDDEAAGLLFQTAAAVIVHHRSRAVPRPAARRSDGLRETVY
jgi:AcrR family transcriptional regulator